MFVVGMRFGKIAPNNWIDETRFRQSSLYICATKIGNNFNVLIYLSIIIKH